MVEQVPSVGVGARRFPLAPGEASKEGGFEGSAPLPSVGRKHVAPRQVRVTASPVRGRSKGHRWRPTGAGRTSPAIEAGERVLTRASSHGGAKPLPLRRPILLLVILDYPPNYEYETDWYQ
jgi:hypothetical protein